MKKFMYIDTCERKINEPTFFDTKEKAIYYMVNDFCVVRDISSSIVPDIVDEETLKNALAIFEKNNLVDDENNVDIENLQAWGETYNHDNWDAEIFEVEV